MLLQSSARLLVVLVLSLRFHGIVDAPAPGPARSVRLRPAPPVPALAPPRPPPAPARDPRPPLLLLLLLLLLLFLANPDNVMDVERLHATWKWVLMKRRSLKLKSLNAWLKLGSFLHHNGALPSVDVLTPIHPGHKGRVLGGP